MIVGPHTSWQDIVICLGFRSVLRLNNARFLAKKELFRPPFGFIFRWLGANPVDRNAKKNMVDQVVDMYNSHEQFAIALSPEGTRKKVDRLKTGFYHIAKITGIPIVMTGLDFRNKRLVLSTPFYTSNDEKSDFDTIIRFFSGMEGKNPAQGLGHLKPENYIH
jgi:1-acyl-sn-glycerol-3-phosphate acyltransferase